MRRRREKVREGVRRGGMAGRSHLAEGPRDEGTGAAREELADGGGGADLGGELVHVVAVVDAVRELAAEQPVRGRLGRRLRLALEPLNPPHSLQLGHRRDGAYIRPNEADEGKGGLVRRDDVVLRR